LPQGSLKKIELDLLLANFPLERLDLAPSPRQFIRWRRRRHLRRSRR
jgi:hypothetical protein